MAAMLGVVSGRVVRSFEIQVAKATNGQKNGSAEESIQIIIHLIAIVLNRLESCDSTTAVRSYGDQA